MSYAYSRDRPKSLSEAGSFEECESINSILNNPSLGYRSRIFINTAAALEGCDDQMLPASFTALEKEMDFNPILLGHLSMIQFLTWALSNPFWGYVSDMYERKFILAYGCLFWGLVTSFLAFSNQYLYMALLRGLNGFFLGSLGPVSQTILADYSSSNTRGLVFGLIQMSTNIGRIISSFVTTSVGTMSLWGFSGWRWCVIVSGLLSGLLGLMILIFMPRVPRILPSSLSIEERVQLATYGQRHRGVTQQKMNNFKLMEGIKQIFRIRSILVLLLEGFIGQIPYNSFAFLTMYFQCCEFSDTRAAAITALMLLGSMIAGPIGGYLADKASSKMQSRRTVYSSQTFRLEARPLIAQIAMLCRLPLLVFLLHPKIVPLGQPFYRVALAGFSLGLFSFVGAAASRPILSDVVLPRYRALAFSMACSIEGVCSAFLGAPLTGILAEKSFGYVSYDVPVNNLFKEQRVSNSQALGSALLIMSTIPWFISSCLFFALHYTYANDREKASSMARMQSLKNYGLMETESATAGNRLIDNVMKRIIIEDEPYGYMTTGTTD